MEYISVLVDNKIDRIPISMNKSVLELLIEHSYVLPSICGGRGTCGKCKIRVLEGVLEATLADKKYFSEKELEEGYRLSCVAYPISSITVNLLAKSEEDFYIPSQAKTKKSVSKVGLTYGIGIDIGTTTIAMELVEKETGVVISYYSGINHQRSYGADVISRIEQANLGKRAELTESIRKDIKEGIISLLKEGGVEISEVSDLVISANSTMGHLFLGYSVEGLGSYPFIPYNIDLVEVFGEEIFPDLKWKGKVTVLPGISAFVGGDVVSGLYQCGFYQIEKPTLFIDLGTNGELALGTKEKILVSSTAAGPVFEGGNIAWGTGSIPGAISEARVEDGAIIVKTIYSKTPVGICGTGLIAIISALLNLGILKQDGMLEGSFAETGYVLARTENDEWIKITQGDIREFQLAKAAIQAGIQMLLNEAGILASQLHRVYIAGGFGAKLNIKQAIDVGLLPKECIGRIKAVGNTSLAGSKSYLLDSQSLSAFEFIKKNSQNINLAEEKTFANLYTSYLNF